jgi:hypothetical protein
VVSRAEDLFLEIDTTKRKELGTVRKTLALVSRALFYASKLSLAQLQPACYRNIWLCSIIASAALMLYPQVAHF